MFKRRLATYSFAISTLCLAFFFLSLCAPLLAAGKQELTGSYQVQSAVALGSNVEVTLRLTLVNRGVAAFSAQKLRLNPAMTVGSKAEDTAGISLPAKGRAQLTKQIQVSNRQYEALKAGTPFSLSFVVDGSGSQRNNRTILVTQEKVSPAQSASQVAQPKAAKTKTAATLVTALKPLQEKPASSSPSSIITTIAGGGPNNVAALNTPLYSPWAVAADLFGNTYIMAANANRIYKVDSKGTLTVFAGNGALGSSGDGGPATQAEIGAPLALAVDAAGDVFISSNNMIREVTPDGTIQTVAGNGCYGYVVEGSPAVQACLAYPYGIAVSGNNVFIADTSANAVRQFTVGGTIQTVAGTGTAGYTGDGGLAILAQLSGPTGVAVDPKGNLFIADQSSVIREVTPSGWIWPFSSSVRLPGGSIAGVAPYSLVALDTELILATDPQNEVVLEFNGGGPGVIVAGTYQTAWSYSYAYPPPVSEPATQAHFYGPYGLAIDAYGNVLVADGYNRFIRSFTIGGNMQTVAGDGLAYYGGDNGPATDAVLGSARNMCDPWFCPRVTVNGTGNVVLSDRMNNAIRQVDSLGKITTIAGEPTLGYGGWWGDEGWATSAGLSQPEGVTYDKDGNLYIADTGNSLIRKVTTDGYIHTIAGNQQADFYGDYGPATDAALGNPQGVAVDSSGNVFIADTSNCVIRRVDAQTQYITTVAGSVSQLCNDFTYTGDGGLATSATLSLPRAVAFDAAGNLYIADSNNKVIRRVDAKTQIITTVAGTGDNGYDGDGGSAVSTRLSYPTDVVVDGAGNLFIADTYNNLVREVTTDGNIHIVAGNGGVAGTGSQDFSGDGGLATAAALSAPTGVAGDSLGNLYIFDANNARVRQVTNVFNPKAAPPSGPVFNISPNPVAFGNHLVGGPSSNQHLTISNTGTAQLIVNPLSAWISPPNNPGDFSFGYGSSAGWCDLSQQITLDPGQSCDFGMGFYPQGPGAKSLTYQITDNAPGSPHSVTATGTGVTSLTGPALVVTGSTDFNSQTVGITSAPQTLTLTNWGTADLVMTSPPTMFSYGATAWDDFKYNPYGGGTCGYPSGSSPVVLAFGQSCTLQVTFDPYLVGARTMAMAISSNDPNSPQVVNFTGTGLLPPGVLAVVQVGGASSSWIKKLAFDPVANKLYVADNNTVTVMDAATYATSTISNVGGYGPIALAVNPVTNKIYVTTEAGASVIDGSSYQVTPVNTSGLNSSPDIAVNTKTNKIYVAGGGSSKIGIIDGATNNFTSFGSTYGGQLGLEPFSLAVNETTNTIYMANSYTYNVAVVDGAFNDAAHSSMIQGVTGAWLMALNPITNKLYVTNNGGTGMTVIDGATKTTSTVTVGAMSLEYPAVNPVTNRIYVPTSPSTVAVIDGSTQTKIAAVPVGQYPGVAAIDTTTNEIYVTNNSSNSVTIIDGNTNNTTTVIADTQPWSVVVNQNAHVAYVLNQRNSSLGSVFVIPSQKQSAPQITVSPLDQQVSVGATVTFTAAGTGTPTPTVKWQVSTDGGATYNDVPGQTTTTLTFTALASQNGYKYRAMFTNSGGSTPTSAATLTVILPVLTVTVNNAERAYGAPTPAFTVSYSGFVNGDTQAVLSGSPSIATTATANSPFGSYPITATQGTLAASNYTFNFVAGTLTVDKATLTITANSLPKTYGAVTTFAGTEFTTIGLVNGDTVTSVSLSSSGAVATATVGPYNIVPSNAVGTGLGNYNISYLNGTLSVGAANLSITASNRSKTYGNTVTFAGTEFTTIGLVNGNTVTSVSLSSSGAVATATVGPYNIVPSNAVGTGLGNYNISYLNGTLTVGPANLTVTANNASRGVGAANPVFTASYSGFMNGQTATVLSGSPVFSTTATSSSPAGLYPIYDSLGTLTAANYTFSFVSGTLSVVAPSVVQLVVTTSVVKQLGGFQATITVTNNGSGAASNVQLTTAILGTAPGSPVPVSLGTIAGGGASAKTVITFPSSAGTSGSTAVAKYSGAYNGGTFSSSLRVVLP